MVTTDQKEDEVSQSAGGAELCCLICAVPITQCHLGIDACRACAVFYKRCLNLKRPLKCKEGDNACIDRDPTTSCRLCRFSRFSAVFDKACAGELPDWLSEGLGEVREEEEEAPEAEALEEDDEGVASDASNESVPESPSFIDHNSYFDCEPSGSEATPLLQRLRRAYSLMCMTRKSSEQATSPPLRLNEIHALMKDDRLEFTPATYAAVIPNSLVFFSALLDFARMTFEDFRDLAPESRHFIIARGFHLVYTLDAAYRAARHFPGDDTVWVANVVHNLEKIDHEEEIGTLAKYLFRFSSYRAYCNDEVIESFFDDCPQPIDKEQVIKEFRKNMQLTGRVNKAEFERVRPSADEFVALVGLAIWNEETSNISEQLGRLVDRNRAALMAELHRVYVSRGIANYAPRIGELHCLLMNVRKTSDRIAEDVQIYRLMNLFNEHLDDS